jgi:tetratricopeptide (TPR) repeat protein
LTRSALYHYTREYQKSLEAAQHARNIAPSDLGALRAELIALAALGDTASVARRLEMVAAGTRNRSWFDFAGDLYLMTGQELTAHGFHAAGKAAAQKALAWFDTRTVEDWKNPNVAFRGAIGYLSNNRVSDAERILLDLLKKYPNDRRYIGTYGRLLAHKGDTIGALRISKRLAELPSEKFSGTPSFERAQISAEMGRKDETVALLQEAFGQGVGFVSYRSRIHAFDNFVRMTNYPPLKLLLTPQR